MYLLMIAMVKMWKLNYKLRYEIYDLCHPDPECSGEVSVRRSSDQEILRFAQNDIKYHVSCIENKLKRRTNEPNNI